MSTSRQKHLNQALMRIPRRAENADRHTLSTTYVAAGSFSAMINSTDHQILYGRRGTGKTHALQYLSDLVQSCGDIAIYLDLRTLGSSGGLYSDSSVATPMRGTQLLVDTLEALHEEMLAVAVEQDLPGQDDVLRALDALADAATSVQVVGEVERETTIGGASESTHTAGLTVSSTPSATLSVTGRRAVTAQSRLRRSGVERQHVMFGPLGRALRSLTVALRPARLWLLLDEWSSIPLDLQPLLADLLRRSILPVTGITVKIAAIARRSCFMTPVARGDYLGIEVGSDAASAINLDDVMIFDNKRDRAKEFFGDLFHHHAIARLATMVPNPPSNAQALLEEMFNGTAFTELVRAAEGVPRDAINIAALAAQYAHTEAITLSDVRMAARDWYLRDKQTAISADDTARRTLRLLVDEVVGRRRSRTFVLEQSAEADHESIDVLYDARLLHILRRGIVDRNHPGQLYDGFAIDYGCYVTLLLDGGHRFRPKDRGAWLTSSSGVPPDGFNLPSVAIDLSALL